VSDACNIAAVFRAVFGASFYPVVTKTLGKETGYECFECGPGLLC
jgi:hypothetical protein